MIRWFANNGIAANFLMMAILVAGIYTAIYRVPLEITPALSWNTVMIEMPYRGGTAKDVERAVLILIEEALEGVKASPCSRRPWKRVPGVSNPLSSSR